MEKTFLVRVLFLKNSMRYRPEMGGPQIDKI